MDKTLVGFGMDGSASLIQGQDMSSSPSGIHLGKGWFVSLALSISIPKGKMTSSQPEPFKDGEFYSTTALVGCNSFSYLFVRNGEVQ